MQVMQTQTHLLLQSQQRLHKLFFFLQKLGCQKPCCDQARLSCLVNKQFASMHNRMRLLILTSIYSFLHDNFSPNRFNGPIRSSSQNVCLSLSIYIYMYIYMYMSPPHAILPGEQRRSQGSKVASQTSDHMIRSQPLIGRPPTPSAPPPPGFPRVFFPGFSWGFPRIFFLFFSNRATSI